MSNVNANIGQNLFTEENQTLDIAVEYSAENSLNFKNWDELEAAANSLFKDLTPVDPNTIFEELNEEDVIFEEISIDEIKPEIQKDNIFKNKNIIEDENHENKLIFEEDSIIDDDPFFENEIVIIDKPIINEDISVAEEIIIEEEIIVDEPIIEEKFVVIDESNIEDDPIIKTKITIDDESKLQTELISEDESVLSVEDKIEKKHLVQENQSIEDEVKEEKIIESNQKLDKGANSDMTNQSFDDSAYAPEHIEKLRAELMAEIAAGIPGKKADDDVDLFREAQELLHSVNPNVANEKDNQEAQNSNTEPMSEVEAPYEFDFIW